MSKDAMSIDPKRISLLADLKKQASRTADFALQSISRAASDQAKVDLYTADIHELTGIDPATFEIDIDTQKFVPKVEL